MWIFIGIFLGSVVTSSHDTREACEGRLTILKEKGVNGQCISQPPAMGTFQLRNNGLFISPNISVN